MHVRAAIGAALAVAALALSPAGSAAAMPATDPVDLEGAYVVDGPGVFEGSLDEIDQALDGLFDRTRTGLYVVAVDRFTGAADGQDWAHRSAEISGLGDRDLLLAIAVDDREVRWSAADGYPLDDDALERVAAERLLPALRDDDFAGAVIAFADGLGDESAGGIPVVPILVGVAVLGVAGFVIFRIVRARRRDAAEESADRQSQQDLDRKAGTLLVALDDALRTSEQELGFAQAQFGEEATAEFAATLGEATETARRAFAIQQRLDDGEPETPEQRRALTLELIALCESADAALDAQTEAFERLRSLEANAGEVLERVAATHGGLPARVDAAEAAVTTLRERYGAPAVTVVDGSIEQARELVRFAGESLGTARTALETDDRSTAAVAVRRAEQAVAQVETLLGGIETLETELPKLAQRLTAAIDDTRADIAEARAVPTTGSHGGDGPAITAAVAEAERVLGEVEKRDPATALVAVEKANAQLNETLGAVRDRQARATRALAMLPRLESGARAKLTSAQEYITTRRGGIGATARTRIAEAERRLAEAAALAGTDPVAALAAAQRADSLAQSAIELARQDVAASTVHGYPGGGFGSGRDGGDSVLGGILGGLISAGSRSSGFGGSRRSSWGSSRRSSGSGSFGGRRSSGSRRSSGRSRGGRRGGGGRF